MEARRIVSTGRPLRAVLKAVPSKSVTHRALVAAALASGPSAILDPLDADDTRATLEGLGALGLVAVAGSGRWSVEGCAGRVPGGGEMFLRAPGPTLRLLLAVAALGERPTRLDGSERLRERPVRDLVRSLASLGGRLRGDRPPLEAGGTRMDGGAVRLPAGRSSQFASALLLVGPCLPRGLDLMLEPPVVSEPYVDLSAQVLGAFGGHVERRAEHVWRVEPGGCRGREFRVEGDHSSASYPLTAAAIVGGIVRVQGLDPSSRQPDARLSRILAGLGCQVRVGADWIEVEGSGSFPGFDLDLGEAPDLAPTLAAAALFAEGPSVLRGVAHLRDKESDRLAVLARGLTRLGRPAHDRADALVIDPLPARGLRGARIDPESDHRIAMAFAVAGLRLDGIEVADPLCVAKSYPGFWEDLAALSRCEGDRS